MIYRFNTRKLSKCTPCIPPVSFCSWASSTRGLFQACNKDSLYNNRATYIVTVNCEAEGCLTYSVFKLLVARSLCPEFRGLHTKQLR